MIDDIELLAAEIELDRTLMWLANTFPDVYSVYQIASLRWLPAKMIAEKTVEHNAATDRGGDDAQ